MFSFIQQPSKDQYYQFFQNMNDALIVISLNEHQQMDIMIEANEAACCQLGYSREELIGMPVSRIVAASHRHLIKETMPALLEGQPLILESVHEKKDGDTLPVEVSVRLVYDDYRVPYVLSNIRDISERKKIENALSQTRLQFNSLFEHNPNPVFSFDMKGNFITANPQCETITGYAIEELMNKPFTPLIAPESQADTAAHFAKSLQGVPHSYTSTLIRKNGTRYTVEATNIPMYEGDKQTGVFGIVRDITDRLKAEQFLHIQRQMLEKIILDQPLHSLLEELIDFIETQVPESRCFIHLVTGQSFSSVIAPSMSDSFRLRAEQCPFSSESASFGQAAVFGETVFAPDTATDKAWKNWTQAARAEQIVSCWSEPLFNRANDVIGVLSIAYSQPKQLSEDDRALMNHARHLATLAIQDANDKNLIHHLAYHDHLTDLPNRRAFQETADRLLEEAETNQQTLSLLCLDLDRFKFVNDSAGHHAGDILLKQTAARLLHDADPHVHVFRQGGDEFLLIFEKTALAEAEQAAQTLLSLFSTPFLLDEQEIVMTPSIGISSFPQHGHTSEELMKHADMAMYEAKKAGKNTYRVYNDQFPDLPMQTLEIEQMLRQAVKKEEFLLHYQPQIDTKTGKVTGAEALIRWKNDKLGMVSPARFIPIAEETGLIVDIGEWTIRTACRQNKQWQEQGFPPIPVSVNLSMRQFYQANLVPTIDAILKETGLEPHYLELEVTESMTMHLETAGQILRDLKELGIRLALDDFGTGYSSLHYLKRLPIEKLKIDQSFIRDLPADSDDCDIVKAIITMGHSLQKKIVAEGVETEQQLAFLLDHQCEQVQGYYFSRPVPPDQLFPLSSH